MTSAIRARGLSKLYASRRHLFGGMTYTPAVQQIDLDLDSGQVLGIVGPNGAGKTTLLRLLGATLLPSSGWASVGGSTLTDARSVKSIVGLASGDDRGFYARLSTNDNLAFFGALRGLSGHALARCVSEKIATFELQEVADRAVQKLSTGQRQRLSLARATLHNPRILLLDEPTRGLDPLMTERVERWLVTWLSGQSGRAVILASHDLGQVERVCDSVMFLRSGCVVQTGGSAADNELRETLRRIAG
jgi:ABC-type multidrug transport system ATPase subunit